MILQSKNLFFLIFRSGGYKISALDVERVLLSHPSVKEVAVLGIEDLTWGQKVAAVIVLNPGIEQLELSSVRYFACLTFLNYLAINSFFSFVSGQKIRWHPIVFLP
jgi:acyl-CoA synthetase (AMP-forming)/AMP-acid ligase II